MNLKENKERNMECLKERKRRKKLCNYNLE